MTVFIIIFGALTLLAGIVIIINPGGQGRATATY